MNGLDVRNEDRADTEKNGTPISRRGLLAALAIAAGLGLAGLAYADSDDSHGAGRGGHYYWGITEPYTTVTASAVRRIGSNGMPMQARHFESRWQWSSPPTIQTPYTNGVACSRFHNAATRITSTRTGFGTHAIKTTILSTTGTVPTGRPRRDASRSIIHS